ncbi:MAG: hypothetical protein M1281_07400 [Chloroflexi bacterium]|nr:hypothetical protein [Chloroflexota bacterium]
MKAQNERRWVLYFALVVMAVTTVPYLIAFATAGSSWRFTGFVFGVDDGNSYIAKMLSGQAGAWLFRTPYTTFPQNGVLTFLPYILLGKLASPPALHEQLVVLFHIFRFGAGIALIYATYDFISILISEPNRRRLALAVIILGGGLGWLLILVGGSNWLGSMPLDFYSPESFGFLEIYGLPHLALARALLFWGLVQYLSPFDEQSEKRKSIQGGLLWFLATLIQPLTIATGIVVLLMHLGITGFWQYRQKTLSKVEGWKPWSIYMRRAVIMAAFAFPIIAYTLITSIVDPFMVAWTRQNIILSPNFFHYLAAYGLLIPAAFLGARKIFASDKSRGFLLAGWILVFPVLAYAPYNLQRRLPEGVWAVWAILAVIGIEGVHYKRIHLSTALWLVFPSTLILLVGGIFSILHPQEPLFQPADQVAVFDYLTAHAAPGDVVLTAKPSGNALPAWAPLRVIVGHGPESINQDAISQTVASFYSNGISDNARMEILKTYHIRYILYGPHERDLGRWDPRQENSLVLVFHRGDYLLFSTLQGTAVQ